MNIIPAIDLRLGRVVRLAQGMVDRETVYSNDPVKMAKKWDAYGVGLIHIVDLDGAIEGELKNFEIVKKIAKSVKAKVELGGGIRNIETIDKVLSAGIENVCVGTRALDRDFLKLAGARFGKRMVVSIDAKNGYIYSKGWVENTGVRALDLAKEIEDYGVTTIDYTDISRDGMLEGPNITSLKEIIAATNLNVVAAGGVSTIDDIKRLSALAEPRLVGAILGKALYEGRIELDEAMSVVSSAN